MEKVFVDVIVKHSRSGEIIPQKVIWKTGITYEVDRIIDVRNASSLKVGGVGKRFTCRIMGKEVYLWIEEDRNCTKWFVERK